MLAGASASAAQAQETSQVVPFKAAIAGQPDGPVALRFRLYPSQEGGSFCFEESQPAVAVTGGNFSVYLGGATGAGIPSSCFAANPSLWISYALESAPEVELGGRSPVTSAGFAHFALTPRDHQACRECPGLLDRPGRMMSSAILRW